MADMFNLNFKFYVQVQTRPCHGLFRRLLQEDREPPPRPRINLTPGLLDALRPTGYRPAQKRLSPRQLQILFSFLGEP